MKNKTKFSRQAKEEKKNQSVNEINFVINKN